MRFEVLEQIRQGASAWPDSEIILPRRNLVRYLDGRVPQVPVLFTQTRSGHPGSSTLLFPSSSCCRPHRSTRPIAIQPSILPVPCLLLNLFVLACYPLPCLLALSLEVFTLPAPALSGSLEVPLTTLARYPPVSASPLE
jgi:hypothetical protein